MSRASSSTYSFFSSNLPKTVRGYLSVCGNYAIFVEPVAAILGLSFSTGGLVRKFDKADNRSGGNIGAERRKFLSEGVCIVV